METSSSSPPIASPIAFQKDLIVWKPDTGEPLISEEQVGFRRT